MVAVKRLGWLKSTDKIYSTGLVVAGRKVPIGENTPPEMSTEEFNRLSAEERTQILGYRNIFDGPEACKKGDMSPTPAKRPKASKKK